MPGDWSLAEVEAAVTSYFGMLESELRGEPFNKTERRRKLRALLNNRSDGSVERKHQNISAILLRLDAPYVRGYKPLSNYQQLLYEVVVERLARTPALVEAIRLRAEYPLAGSESQPADLLDRLVDRPVMPDARSRTSIVADAPRVRARTNYLELEARNRRLGLEGEQFVMRFEAERLWRANRKKLANRIEHVSQTRGEIEGYDVLSFEENGSERLIEVKTTTFGEFTPFFVSRHEVDVSFERADQYFVYRLFDFRDDPKLFVVPGDIAHSFTLEAIQFEAR